MAKTPLYVDSAWQYRREESGDEFAPIERWSSDKQDFASHEDAAEGFAKSLTRHDPDFYAILEEEGILVEIRSPRGAVRQMRVGGYTSFVYVASEVPS